MTANGSVVVTFADTRTIQMMSATDGNVTGEIQIMTVNQPVSALPVNGEDNGFVVCCGSETGLEWLICGHHLEEAAQSLEEPVHLPSLCDISGLVPDPFGSYIGFSTAMNAIKLFDSTFGFLQPLFSGLEDVEHPMALTLHPTSGRVAIGQRNGIIKLYQLLKTRETIEIGLCSWA